MAGCGCTDAGREAQARPEWLPAQGPPRADAGSVPPDAKSGGTKPIGAHAGGAVPRSGMRPQVALPASLGVCTPEDPLMLLTLLNIALADTITLETGVTIEGDLARYELGGDCQVSVTEGDFQGVIVIVPCHRIAAFVRAPKAAPVVVAVVEPEPAEVTVEQPLSTPSAASIAEALAAALPAAPAIPLDPYEQFPVAGPVVESSDDPLEMPDSDGDTEYSDESDDAPEFQGATTQPHAAPSMLPVTTRSISF